MKTFLAGAATAALLPLAAATLLAVPATAAASPRPARATGAPRSTSTARAVTPNVLPGLGHATDLGAAAPGTPLHLVVSLARPRPAAEQRRLTAEHTPGSPQEGRYLTPTGFARRFGVDPTTRAATRGVLTGHGLRVVSVSRAGDVWRVSGSARQVGATFRTPLHRYRVGSTRFLASPDAPQFPASLPIFNIVGLNTLQRYRTTSGPTTQQDTCLQSECTGTTTPRDLWTAYDQGRRFTGRHQGVAVFGEGASDGVVSDLRVFEREQHLPRVPVRVVHPDGDTHLGDDSGHEEWNIDTQASTGMAPDADRLTLYFGSDLSDADVDAVFSTYADDPHAPLQASASYGECETVPVVSAAASPVVNDPTVSTLPVGVGIGNDSDATLTPIVEQAALEGRSVFVSTGDTGASCPLVYAAVVGAGNGVLDQGVSVTNSPASLPWVVAVGGTVLYTDGKGHRTHEYGWTYSGGGSTLFVDQPDYQQGVAGDDVPCVVTGAACRGISDVAAQSGDVLTNGYDIVSDGADTVGGGTSLSAPLMQGMWARVQSAAGVRGLGFADYGLYRAGLSAHPERDFFDVTSTDTATGAPATNGLYPTTPGWDYVTGWGTPRVQGLACSLAGRC